MDFLELRKKVIKKYFSNMNDRQFEAVTTVNGPLLVLAGAGSGKTTVLVNRVLNIVKFGDGYQSKYIPEFTREDVELGQSYVEGTADNLPEGMFSVNPAYPWQILAITFTNKAAQELKERIAQKLGDKADDICAGTFHSVCGKILRRNADLLGYTSHFTIYDTDDQQRVMKEIMKQNNIDDKFVPYRYVLSLISSAKDSLISADEYMKSCGDDFRQKAVGKLYKLYQKKLKSCNAMDFDDMIYNTVILLKNNPDVLEFYSNKFRYVMVDEYQDTNHAQYVLISMLASGRNNICVVGDDDQSIYRFRGATIENILNFEDEYDNAKTIRLEQNYRSTSNILNAANSVISHNIGRKGKTLWTDRGEGEKITVYTAPDEREEARWVANDILDNVRKGAKFSDHAVLYRMNAQANALESVFARSGISYKVIGGTRFYDRKEIRDVMAYLHLINNNDDDLRLRRIINEPKRGIGDTTVNRAAEIASQLGISLFDVFKNSEDYPSVSRVAARAGEFCRIIDDLTEKSTELTVSELFEEMLDETGYIRALEAEGDESQDRINNVKELLSTITQYELESDEPSLSEFLEQIALVSDIDSLDTNADKTVLMTMHSAKGLEFNNVYIIGMEEGIFPGNQSIYGGPEEIEEERRLAYVAITRAKKKLCITNCLMRMMFGTTNRNRPSRFLKELPEKYCDFGGSISFGKTYYGGYDKSVSAAANVKKTAYNYLSSSYAEVAAKTDSPVNTDNNIYFVGQQVIHKTFGSGIILSVTPAGNDKMLEIAFENAGTKKIMANYAKLTV